MFSHIDQSDYINANLVEVMSQFFDLIGEL